MKTLACSLMVAVGLGLSSATFAVGEQDQQITGTVVKVELPMMTIETAKKERWEFSMEGGIKPKVGEKLTVHYTVTGRGKHIAYKIEKTR